MRKGIHTPTHSGRQDLSMGHSFNILDDMYGLLGPGKLNERIAFVKVVKNLRTGALPAGLFSVFLTEVGWPLKDSELRGQFFQAWLGPSIVADEVAFTSV